MSELNWVDVTGSSRIAAMAYDPESAAIYVRFARSDVEWCYEGCVEHEWKQFTRPSQSKGQYIQDVLNFKNHHRRE